MPISLNAQLIEPEGHKRPRVCGPRALMTLRLVALTLRSCDNSDQHTSTDRLKLLSTCDINDQHTWCIAQVEFELTTVPALVYLVEATYEALTARTTAFIRFFAAWMRDVALSSFNTILWNTITERTISRSISKLQNDS